MTSEFITVNEVAKVLNTTPKTVREWIKNKVIPAYKFGTQYRISKIEFEKFIINSKL